jgi:hypothetical protein
MVSAIIQALAAGIAALPTETIPYKNRRVVVEIALLGFVKGYTLKNIRELIQQFNNETGNGKDYKFIEGNAVFGMNVPSWSVRTLGSIGTVGTARYASTMDCLLDRLEWDKRRGISPDEDNYLERVQQRNYNPSTNYPTVVRKYNDHYTTVVVAFIVLPVAVVGTVYFLRTIR